MTTIGNQSTEFSNVCNIETGTVPVKLEPESEVNEEELCYICGSAVHTRNMCPYLVDEEGQLYTASVHTTTHQLTDGSIEYDMSKTQKKYILPAQFVTHNVSQESTNKVPLSTVEFLYGLKK
jgi:hypothetical protein